MATAEEREPYTEEYLRDLTKDKLGNLVRQQMECWPSKEMKFNVSKLRVEQLKGALLDPNNHFSKPKTSSPTQSAGQHKHSAPLPHSSSSGVLPTSQRDVGTTLPPPSVELTPLDQPAREHRDGADVDSDQQEKTTIRLFLNDHRVCPVRKSAVQVHINKRHITLDEQFVNARAIISELQKSLLALRGCVQLAYPCPQDNEYLEYFIRITHGTLEDGDFNPPTLPISPTRSIQIHVEDALVCTTAMPTATSNARPGTRDATESPQEHDALGSWLRDKLLSRPEHDFFVASKHRALQNPDILRVWQFVGSFHTEYYNSKDTPSHKRITKGMIQTALGVGETWLNEALAGNRLATMYGTNKSTTKWSPEVEAELVRVRETPKGREELLKYLKNWDEVCRSDGQNDCN